MRAPLGEYGGGIDLGKVLGAPHMIAKIKRLGWSGAEVREFVDDLKEHGFEVLDDFAGGHLSEIPNTPLYPVMLELTAIRYVLWKAEGSPEPEEIDFDPETGEVLKGAV